MPVEGGHLVCVDKSTQLIQQKINKKGYEAKFTELAENLNRF
jgi:hypothetical protein